MQTRRDFIATGSALAAATAMSDNLLAQRPAHARVVQLEHAGATTSKIRLDDAIVERLVREALKTWSGTNTAAEALAKYFNKDQKIAIKINTLGSPYSAVNPITAFTLAKIFLEMGVPVDNVRIFDQYQSRMRKAKYRLRRRKGEIWVTQHIGRDRKMQRYEHNGYKVNFHWAKEIVWPDAVLNVCVPKDHDLTGVTGALKNMAMGVVKPTAKRYANKENPGHYTVVPRFHRGNCDPAIPKLYSRPMIRGKVKLIVCDALRVLYHGGPQDKARYRKLHNQIWVTDDPVANDSLILELVNKIRNEKGMKPVEEDLFRGKKRLPTYLKTANEMGLGVNDLNRIKVEKKILS